MPTLTDALFGQLAVLKADVLRLSNHFATRNNNINNTGDRMSETTAVAKAEEAAAALRKQDPGLTEAKAFVKAMQEAGPELQQQYVEEMRRPPAPTAPVPAPSLPKPAALAKAEEAAAALRKQDPGLSDMEALDAAFRADPGMQERYLAEMRA